MGIQVYFQNEAPTPKGVTPESPVIAFYGGGFFIPWMLGVCKQLLILHELRNINLDKFVFSGVSAGSGAAVMLACGARCDQVGDMLSGDVPSPMTPGTKFSIIGPEFRLILVYV